LIDRQRVAYLNAQLAKRGAIRWQLICCEDLGSSVFSHCFYGEFLSSSFISALGDEAFKHLTFLVHGPPKVKPLAVYSYKDFVKMPLPAQMLASPLLPDFSREFRPKMAHPKPNSLLTNIDSALMQNVFDLAKTERLSNVIHHCQAYDLGRRFEVLERVCCGHEGQL
jgi:hypothetical protein